MLEKTSEKSAKLCTQIPESFLAWSFLAWSHSERCHSRLSRSRLGRSKLGRSGLGRCTFGTFGWENGILEERWMGGLCVEVEAWNQMVSH
jgi:hypothetical protein